jgi:hypothetical protein
MNRRTRAGLAAGAALLVAGLCGAGFGAPTAGAAPVVVTDRGGDTLTDAVEEAITAPAADIISTSADSTPDGITLAFRVAKMADPASDFNWTSDLTIASWQLDTNGDSDADYVIDYYRDEDTKALTADLDKVGPGHPPDECAPKAGYSADSGYSVVVDPKCLGGASAFSYQVDVAYTTDAKDDSADVATDFSPDKDWTGPVPVTLPTGAAPVPLVPPVTNSNPPPSASSTPSAPETGPGPKSNATTPTTARTVKPQQVTSATRPASSRPPAVTDGAPAPDLAHTGISDRVMRLGGFAAGIILIGIGLLFANRRPSLR